MKSTRLLIVLVLLVAAGNGLLAWLCNLPQDVGPDVPEGKLSSVSFAPFREGQSPITEIFPTTGQIDADLSMLADKTRSIRTYASLGGLKKVPELARKHGLKMIQGAWLSFYTMIEENDAEVQQLISAANAYPDVIERVIVGNEVLLRGEMQSQQLLDYIRQVKKAVKQPVSYADVWSFYMQHPEIAKEVDFITIHILPYWEDEPLDIERSAEHVVNIVRKIHTAYPDKPILIGESGWPSAGRQRGWAVPSVVNEAKYIRKLVQVAKQNNFDYNIVEAFNQPWKSVLEGVVGAKWGLYSAERKAVFPLTGKVTENPLWIQQTLWACLLFVGVVGVSARRCLQLSPLRLAGFLLFTQLLTALLAYQAVNLWTTTFSDMQRLQVLVVVSFSAALGGLAVYRALDLLHEQASSLRLSKWLQYLLLGFVAFAIYKSLGLALDGRYLSIPYPSVCIAITAVLGLAFFTYFFGQRNLFEALQLRSLSGVAEIGPKRCAAAYLPVAVVGLYLVASEASYIMSEETYQVAFPLFRDRVWAGVMRTVTHSEILGWVPVIAAALSVMPRKAAGYILVVMLLAVVYGETSAFAAGHDFIEAHLQPGERWGTAFVYTLSNRQMLLWLAGLLVLALPFFADPDKKRSATQAWR